MPQRWTYVSRKPQLLEPKDENLGAAAVDSN